VSHPRFTGPNLAREPFANLRPVRRAGVALWIAVALLGGWNVWAYVRSGSGAAEKRAELERLDRETAASRARIATLEADLRRADLVHANQRTVYLNNRIAERAFSWNLLFDRLVAALPRGVRVTRLSPETETGGRRESAAAVPSDGRVLLDVQGEAEDSEALLAFVDRLFAHPAFDRPSLRREAQNAGGNLEFQVEVRYLPTALPGELGTRAAAPGGESATPPSPGAAAGETASGEPPAPPPPGVAVGGPLARDAVAAPRTPATGAPAGARGSGAAEVPFDEGGSRAAEESPRTARGGAAGAAPAPVPSIFGVPLGARPTASGARR
jgi:Tfp pilus assembly protein PilN